MSTSLKDLGAPKELENDSSVSTLISSLIFNLVINAIFILIFCYLRTKNKYFYSPRTFSKNKDSNPGILPKSFFGWFPPLFKYSTNDYVKYCGPDGYMILYIVKQNFILFCIFSLTACAILIPINVTSDGGLGGLDSLSMSNTTKSPNRLWAHLLCTIFFSVIVVIANYVAASETISLRQKYLNSFNYLQTQRSVTVLVSGIPAEKNNVDDIRAEMGDKLPLDVEIYPIKDPKLLNKPFSERNKYHLSLESELSRLATLEKKRQILIEKNKKPKDKPIERKQKKLGFLGLFGEKVDFIENATSVIVENNTLITEKSSEYMDQPSTFSAFLVFKNVQQAHSFANGSGPKIKALIKKIGFSTVINTEIDPQDVVWNNLSVSQTTQHLRRIISYIVSFAIILLWIIPTGFVSIIANFNTLAKYSVFSWVNDLPSFVKGILQGLIPAVALVILTIIVPILFRQLIKFEKGPLSRATELFLIDRFFAFKIINIFIIYLISGTIFSSIKDFIDDPSTVVEQLTSNVPKNSTFYITYVLLLGLGSSSGDISMISGVAIRLLFRKLFGQTPRDVFNNKLPQQLSVGVTIPVLSFVFLLGIVFCTIAPLMTVVSLIFFSLITNSKISKWASATGKFFMSSSGVSEKSSPLLTIPQNERDLNNWQVSEAVSRAESQSEISINNEEQDPSNICNLGYEKLSSPSKLDTFMPPEFSDSGFTTVWVPHIESITVDAVYDETQELLKERGNVVDSDNYFDDRALLHVTTNTLPDSI
ncbi:putative membrane protein [Smittium mucronatum]|uniref:Putative membrane protein n=1 Tax=Smittium mucronatum TaxID=133383 RepID=A0A1R0H2C1_9FUNG|nr:putative membrane protein [Smittium mucronatum]